MPETGDRRRKATLRSLTADDDSGDSSDDEFQVNTIGDSIPVDYWYRDHAHIGYDRSGNVINRGSRSSSATTDVAASTSSTSGPSSSSVASTNVGGDRASKSSRNEPDPLPSVTALLNKGVGTVMDQVVNKHDDPKWWRRIVDHTHGPEAYTLSNDDISNILRLAAGKAPEGMYDPEFEAYAMFEPEDGGIFPISGLGTEPKRRFLPSKWEHKKVMQMVRAIRNGWLRPRAELLREKQEKEKELMFYDVWDTEAANHPRLAGASGRTAYYAAPKIALPGHADSYHPPPEYLSEDRISYENMRSLPASDEIVKDRFERCLDLYLAPRVRKTRMHLDNPDTMLPVLPSPEELRPFPDRLALEFLVGAPVSSISISPDGQWIATGDAAGWVRVYESDTGRCFAAWNFKLELKKQSREDENGRTKDDKELDNAYYAVRKVHWLPVGKLRMLIVAWGNTISLFVPRFLRTPASDTLFERIQPRCLEIGEEMEKRKKQPICIWKVVDAPSASSTALSGEDGQDRKLRNAMHWRVDIEHTSNQRVTDVCVHAKGDYIASVSPTAPRAQAVIVHQLSTARSQPAMAKAPTTPKNVIFHPTRPFLFISSIRSVRIVDLVTASVTKKVSPLHVMGISSMAIHSQTGDHLIIGTTDRRVIWIDLDAPSAPVRVLRHHTKAVGTVAFSQKYPLFATGADDAAMGVFHGSVHDDLVTPPTIVPLKLIAKAHERHEHRGVLDVQFHPHQPWLFSAGADGRVRLWV
eukprot:ANDGO_00885.mRNA.1 hypothetical protein